MLFEDCATNTSNTVDSVDAVHLHLLLTVALF